MTTQRSLRNILSHTVALLLVVFSSVCAQDLEVYRPQIEQLLADRAVAAVELGDRWRTVEPGQMQVSWPDAGVKCLLIGANADTRNGFAVIDEAAQQVVGLVGPVPVPPVPMDEMPPEEAGQVARQFAERHLADLFADGGEVAVTVGEGITPLGARMVRLQRTVAGVQAPTVADVGVRVYDGKVVYWRRHHVPLDGGLQLPGEVSLDQAHSIAAENVPYDDHAPVLWFDEAHRVIVTEDGQRNVWDLWAEIKQLTTPENRLEYFAHWQIDAGSGEVLLSEGHSPGKEPELRLGEVLLSEGHSPGKEPELRLRYYAAGGDHTNPDYGRPAPKPLCTDRRPVWAPDGGVYFLSDRPRAGYPLWGSWPSGLFAVSGDGADLSCVLAEVAGVPAVSPDGTRMLLKDDEGLHVIPVAGGDELLIPKPEGEDDYSYAGWLNDNTLVADLGSGFGSGKLVTLDLTQPEPAPQPTGLTRGTGENFVAFLPMADGTLLYTFYGRRGGNDWDLMRVDLSAAEPTPEVICADPQEGRAMQLMGAGTVLLADTRSSSRRSATYAVDLSTGEATRWQPPDITDPETGERLRPSDIAFSPDGRRMAFTAETTDPAAPATVIWICATDGSDARQVTPATADVVAMAGE